MPELGDLPYLIRLLDDQDPAVRPVVQQQLTDLGGDISQDLAALGIPVPPHEKERLSKLLEPGRRKVLESEWLVPSGGAEALDGDIENFESILSLLSDFLHDGITIRPSLSDSLDLLADEIREEQISPTADELRLWLFAKGSFVGVKKGADAEKHFDLCRVLDVREGNPTSLGILFILMGQRLKIQVEGCNYPGHFLTKIQSEGENFLVDCFNAGRRFKIDTLLESHPEISENARRAVNTEAHLGQIIVRYLTELQYSLQASGRLEDAQLFKKLLHTL